jgi:erythronate-4-phosphate dehydrogenase
MKNILADENIPFVKEAFQEIGEVTTISGRDITPETLKGIEILLVRSITKVNEALLKGSKVKFVGSSTIGTDHIDHKYLKKRKIAFASAPGANSESVAQYVAAGLMVWADYNGVKLADKSIGIVGIGNVGAKVERISRALDMKVLLNDPPLQEKTGDKKYLPINELFKADIITFHVPLTKAGDHPTSHMINRSFLKQMNPDAILINTSRGAVAKDEELLEGLNKGYISQAIVDVWENEPDINVGLMEDVFIGTPHIAGYTLDGKILGVQMIYDAVCKHYKIKPAWDSKKTLPAPPFPKLELKNRRHDDVTTIRAAVRAIYNIRHDDMEMCKLTNLSEEERPVYFDKLRKDYPVRREFQNTKLLLHRTSKYLEQAFKGLGFEIQ